MFTPKGVASLLALVSLTTLLAIESRGQTTNGTILGVISDQSAARMPGVTVTVTNRETGISRKMVTDEAGRYRASDLAVGNYEVRAELAGFKTAVHQGIQLTVAQSAVVDLTLSVGEVTEQAVVTSEAPLVETTNAALSGLVDDKKIRDLPLNGRSFAQLAFLQAGVVPYLRGTHQTDQGEGTKFSVTGSRIDANSVLMDGTNINDQSNATPGSASGNLLGIEMLREFRVLTGTYSAEYGRHSGGIISAVTKSGTNQLHGSAFEFLRNSVLEARNFVDYPTGIRIPPYKRNQFGGTIGGPIRHDRTFFFGGYEGLRERLGLSSAAIVPNAAAHAGLLPNPSGGLRTVGVDSRVKPFLDLYPLPNGPDLGDGTAQFFSNPNQPTREDYAAVRVDHKFSDSDFLFVRYTLDDSTRDQPSTYPTINVDSVVRGQYVTLGEDRIFSPRLLNAFRLGFNRAFSNENNHPLFSVPDSLLFVPGQQLGLITFRGIGITQYGGGAGYPRRFGHNVWQYSDEVTVSRGSHSIKTGMLFERYQSNATLARVFGGQYFFNGLENFLRAQSAEFAGDIPGTDNIRGWRQNLFGFYVQDDFQARSNLTLNLGLRYEFTTIPTEVNGKISNWRHPLTDTQPFVGDPWYQGSYKDFAPRIGISWDPWSNGKTAIRAGFGVFFDHLVTQPLNRVMSRIPPFSQSAALLEPSEFPRIDLTQLKGNLASLVSYALAYETKDPTKLGYSFSIQQEIARQTVVTVAFAGSQSSHLLDGNNGNNALPEIQPDGRKFFRAGLPRRNPNIGQLQFLITPDGNSSYESLQLSLNRRFSNGLQLQGSYTFSKNISDSDGVLGRTLDIQGTVPQDPDNRRAERSLASIDVRHYFSLNYTYDLPLARNLAGAAGKMLSGWQINGITSIAAGTPFTVIDGFNRSRNLATGGNIDDRPNLLPSFIGKNLTKGTSAGCQGVPSGARLGTPERYFDACAFGLPDPGYYGNLGRNNLIGPAW